MGMFEIINFTCPICDEIIEVQSKEGDGILMVLDQRQVPIKIAIDINKRNVTCETCEHTFEIYSTMSSLYMASMDLKRWY